jgi:hypothetical protein
LGFIANTITAVVVHPITCVVVVLTVVVVIGGVVVVIGAIVVVVLTIVVIEGRVFPASYLGIAATRNKKGTNQK